jgi:uncharacterized protein (DUF302 family)
VDLYPALKLAAETAEKTHLNKGNSMKFTTIFTGLLFALTTTLSAGDFFVYGSKNSDGAITPKTIEAAFVKAGFAIADNRDMNGPYQKQFGTTGFTTYNLFTLYHPDIAKKLVNKYPKAGVFVPMSMGIYQKKGEHTIYAAVLTADTQAKILGLDSTDPLLKELETKVRAALKSAMPEGADHSPSYATKPPQGDLLTRFTLEVDEDEVEDMKEEIELLIEDGLKPNGFVLANFTDYNYILTEEETVESAFTFYDTYSICKLKVIYATSQERPETGAFAPCTMAIYKKKDEGEIVVLFPSVYNWLSSAAITDQKSIDELLKAQKDMEQVVSNATE